MKMKRGAIGMNIILFMFITSVFLFLIFQQAVTQSVFQFVGIDPTDGNINGGDLALKFGGLLVGFAIIVGTFSFPNPYAIFAPIALVMLGLMVTVWSSFLTNLGLPSVQVIGLAQPVPIGLLAVGGTLGVLSLLSVIAFLKGGEW